MSDTVISPHPGFCEHVTKMGKLSRKQIATNKVPTPQFRKLPLLRDYRFIDETETQSSEQSPRESLPPSSEKSPPPSSEESQPKSSERLQTQAFIQHDSPRRNESRESYVEMKLGRNMRAAPKGGLVSKYAPTSINSQQLDREPLLHNQPLPSNNIVDYFTNTHCVQTQQSTQAAGLTSKQYPSRSITSPQHPSQDLIEMLNRNNNTQLSHETQVVEPKVSSAEHQESEPNKRLVNIDTKVNENPEIPKFDQEQTFPKGQYQLEKSPVVAPPPPTSFLYESLNADNNYTQPKRSDEGSTQPFTPQESYSHENVSNVSTKTGFTSTEHDLDTNKHIIVEKQETMEEVDDIAEDIEAADDDDDTEIKESDFNF